MIIKSAVFNIILVNTDNIRRKMMMLEPKLLEYFLPINILPIPDDAPNEIPRVLMTTKNGHSNIQISPQAITMVTNFDGEFTKNWDLCLQYLKERIDKILEIAQELSNSEKFLFSGLTTNLVVDTEENVVEKLKNKLLKVKASDGLYDINCKLTLTKEDYYINITYMNNREMEINQVTLKPIREVKNELHIVLDINDRFAFNNIADYSSDKSKINHILEISTDLLVDKVYQFLEKGEIEL